MSSDIDDRALTDALASATYSAAHDKAGQLIDDGNDRGFQYDAFGRLVEVRKVTSRTGGGAINTYTVLAEYRYDGLGQRIAWHRDFDNDGAAEGGGGGEPWIHIVYDDRWRMVALFNAGDPVTEPKELLIPHDAGRDGRGGSSYIDSEHLIFGSPAPSSRPGARDHVYRALGGACGVPCGVRGRSRGPQAQAAFDVARGQDHREVEGVAFQSSVAHAAAPSCCFIIPVGCSTRARSRATRVFHRSCHGYNFFWFRFRL